jgi:Villin headpiece domain/Gelsolin repeat
MLLDAYSEVFVWVGKSSNDKSKELSLDYAGKYISASSMHLEREDATTIVVQSGAEPSIFTRHFKGWDPNYSRNYVNPYQSNSDLQAIALKKALEAPKRLRVNTEKLIPYDKLKDAIVEGIEPDRKEEYIDDATFEMLFKMKREEFEKLARWRKDKMKKQVGLF